MTFVAEPVPHDAPPGAVEDAVIREARRRARRRRARQGIAVAAVGAMAVAALVIRDSQPPLGGGSRAPSGGGFGLTDVSEPVSGPARLVAKWGMVHVGWVLVYDDGRVLSYPDHHPVLERRLTRSGLAAVRAGSLELRSLLESPGVSARAGIWADREGNEYRPAAYAVCLWTGSNQPGEVSALPVGARRILSEARPALADHAGTHSQMAASQVDSAWNCLRVDRADLAALEGSAAGVDRWMSGDVINFARTAGGSRISATVWPIMLHGRWLVWGG